jgi:hypothetical protein
MKWIRAIKEEPPPCEMRMDLDGLFVIFNGMKIARRADPDTPQARTWVSLEPGRRDFWDQQPHRIQVWSEKGTVRGLLRPVLDSYAVGFNPVHGFTSATSAHDAAMDDDGRPLHVLYVGDYDPTGLCMSEVDLPNRFAEYGGDHIKLRRIALTREQVRGLPSFPASDKRKDPRYSWFVANHGDRCWEIDAMDPNDLRDCVEREIARLIEPVAWQRCVAVNAAEQESLKTVLEKWGPDRTRRRRRPRPLPGGAATSGG